MERISNLSVSNFSFLVSLGISVGAWIVIYWARDWFATPDEVHSDLSNLFELTDSNSQRIGHYLAVLFIALSSLGLLLVTKFNLVKFPRKLSIPLGRLHQMIERPSSIFVSVLILSVVLWRWPTNFIPMIVGIFLLVMIAIFLKINIGRQASSFIWLSLILLSVSVFLVLPILLPLDFSNLPISRYVFLVELHYSAVLGAAARLAQGGVLFENVAIMYGLFPPVILSEFGHLDLSGYLRLQQYFNIIFFLCCFLAYGRAAKWQYHTVFILGLLILPWNNNLPEMISTPNQTGMRHFGFALALIFLAYSEKFGPNTSSTLSGILSGFCLLLNPETGIVISVAMTAYVFFSNDIQNWRACLLRYAIFVTSVVGVITIFWTLASQLLVNEPQIDSLKAIFGTLLRFLRGFGGVQMPAFALGFLFLIHAGYYIIIIISKWNFRKLDNLQVVRLSISLMIVGWLAYYFNRPSIRSLWVIFVLYGYLIIPMLHHRYFILLIKRFPKARIPIPALMIILILVPQAISYNFFHIIKSYRYVDHLESNNADNTANYSGIKLDKGIVKSLDRKMRYLKNLPTDESFEYMSAFSFTAPLQSGRSSLGLPRDVFVQIPTIKKYDLLIAQLREKGPNLLLFDDYGAFRQQSLPIWESFYSKLRHQIEPIYKLRETVDGWHVYARER